MSKRLIPFILSSVTFVAITGLTPVMAQEVDLCDPIGRLVSGLDVEAGAELLCAGDVLPTATEDTTVTAVCFSSNEVEAMEVKAREAIAALDLCGSSPSVVQCGDGVCFAPRGEIAAIDISINDMPSLTLLDWNDIPGSERYVIQVFEGQEQIFSAQQDVSHVETYLQLDSSKTVAVTAISPSRFIMGYGSVSLREENEG